MLLLAHTLRHYLYVHDTLTDVWPPDVSQGIMYVQVVAKCTLSGHWAYYWYGKPAGCETSTAFEGLEPLDPPKAVGRNSLMCLHHTSLSEL